MRNISLEFTTTSCNRPEILERTYHSYFSKLEDVNFKASTVYINIDPTPTAENLEKVEAVAKKYFGRVVVNRPCSPNFAKAVIWCFSQVTGPYFFHLEDDWVLLRPVKVMKVIALLGSSNLQCVLNKQKSKIFSREAGQPCLIPSLFSTRIVKKYLQLMKDDLNPEYQMKNIFNSRQNGLHLHKSVRLNENIE